MYFDINVDKKTPKTGMIQFQLLSLSHFFTHTLTETIKWIMDTSKQYQKSFNVFVVFESFVALRRAVYPEQTSGIPTAVSCCAFAVYFFFQKACLFYKFCNLFYSVCVYYIEKNENASFYFLFYMYSVSAEVVTSCNFSKIIQCMFRLSIVFQPPCKRECL